MTKQKILFTTVFFCLMPVVSLFALSKEAKEIIEAYRERVIKAGESNQIIFSNTSSDGYIPGRELALALARVKRARYNRKIQSDFSFYSVKDDSFITSVKNTEKVEEKSNFTASEIKSETDTPIITELEQEKEIITENEVISNEEVDSIEEIDSVEDVDSVEEDISDNEQYAEENIISLPKTDSKYHPGELLEKSLNKVRNINNKKSYHEPVKEKAKAEAKTEAKAKAKTKVETKARARVPLYDASNSNEIIAQANEEIEEIFKNPRYREEIAEQERQRVAPQKAISDSDTNSDDIDDDKFNDYIKKYNFKMPENYRIIVD